MAIIQFWSKGDPEYQFLSNFAETPFYYAGPCWPTAEHLYQALKFDDPRVQGYICELPTPQAAKKYADQHQEGKREGWHERRVQMMRLVLMLKFSQSPMLVDQLLATGDALLVHYAPWDSYWGSGRDGKGENVMGHLLMNLRKWFRHLQ